jgi:hypothetical protein
MEQTIQGGGKITASPTSFEVVAPNGEKFTGKVLCDSKRNLIEWWGQNGGSKNSQEFRNAFNATTRELTPNNCC